MLRLAKLTPRVAAAEGGYDTKYCSSKASLNLCSWMRAAVAKASSNNLDLYLKTLKKLTCSSLIISCTLKPILSKTLSSKG